MIVRGCFTILEMIAVMVVVLLLTAVGMVSYHKIVIRARTSETFPVVNALQVSEVDYYNRTGGYYVAGCYCSPTTTVCCSIIDNALGVKLPTEGVFYGLYGTSAQLQIRVLPNSAPIATLYNKYLGGSSDGQIGCRSDHPWTTFITDRCDFMV